MLRKVILLIAGISISSQVNAINFEDMIGGVLSDVISEVAPVRNENSPVRSMASTDNQPTNADEQYVLQVAERCLHIWIATYSMNGYCKIADNIQNLWKRSKTVSSQDRLKEAQSWGKEKDYVANMFKQPIQKRNYTADIPIDYENGESYKQGVFARCEYLKKQVGIEADHVPFNYRVIDPIKEYYCSVVYGENTITDYTKNLEAMVWMNAQIAFKELDGIIAKDKTRAEKDSQKQTQEIADLKQEQKSAPIVNGQWKRFEMLTADHAVGVMSSDGKSVLAVDCTNGELTTHIDWQIMMLPQSVIVTVDGYVSDKGWNNYKSTSNFDVELIKAMLNAKGNIVATADTQRDTKKKQLFSPRGSTKMIGEVMEYCGY